MEGLGEKGRGGCGSEWWRLLELLGVWLGVAFWGFDLLGCIVSEGVDWWTGERMRW